MNARIDVATRDQIAELAEVAAQTFPLACPPAAAPPDIAAFIAENLSAERFTAYLDDPDRAVLTATVDHRIIGYAMMIRGVPKDADVARVITAGPVVELSKMYVLPRSHGTGTSSALMSAALREADKLGAHCVWLGVNQQNHRAQRFYAKHGFTVAGTRTFRLGTRVERDYVMVRPA
ncbi:MAG: GNAT family N-acetyltransferase [Mycolicibacterium sp.]|uniref:GNAT family N-acetyltransferase n=1 Tax=Mycolicibacterium sp. TaxID=2320850 RepID=UPI003D150499